MKGRGIAPRPLDQLVGDALEPYLREPYDRLLARVGYLGVRARASVEGVVAANPVSGVERVVAVLPVQAVATAATPDLVSPSAAIKDVVASHALDDVVAPLSPYGIVAPKAADDVRSRGAFEGLCCRGSALRAGLEGGRVRTWRCPRNDVVLLLFTVGPGGETVRDPRRRRLRRRCVHV